MPAPPDGSAAACERCGAALQLAHHGRARCLFCLHHQLLPDAVRTPLVEHAALSQRLDGVERGITRLATQRRAFSLMLVPLLPLLGLTIAQLAGATMARADDPVAFAMSAFISVGGVLPFFVVPGVWLHIQRGVRARVLAALPFAQPALEGDHVTSSCPSCGAPQRPVPGQLTATCAHCRTEALLPLPLVEARLARLHAATVAAKARGDVALDAAKAAVEAWQKKVVPLILGTLCFYGAVIVAFVIYVEATRP
ncbi:MAG: hypothetical protein KC492_30525 [Myxococcales bacterium]|nr:hypothetical protein [Myxococcales bacterium]MCB9628451.1 hypothetical protein [Sandaracinaceae bacterium]